MVSYDDAGLEEQLVQSITFHRFQTDRTISTGAWPRLHPYFAWWIMGMTEQNSTLPVYSSVISCVLWCNVNLISHYTEQNNSITRHVRVWYFIKHAVRYQVFVEC